MSDDNGVPNLDAMTPDDLMQFWNRHNHGRSFRKLFPNGGKGTRSATWDLANYASNKATAMQCRLAGKVCEALMYEAIADRIYEGLPDFAKW